MKIQLLVSVTLFMCGTSAFAQANEPCSQPTQLAKIEKSVIAEIRATTSNSYSFNFTPVHQSQTTSDMTVYYEQVDGDLGEIRYAHAVQYKVDPKTCKPRLIKEETLYSEYNPGPGSGPMPEPCADASKLPGVKEAIKADLTSLDSQIMPGSTLGNFAFTSIWKVSGSGDMAVYWEVSKPGQMTKPMLATYNIDANCKPSLQGATAFTWLLTTY